MPSKFDEKKDLNHFEEDQDPGVLWVGPQKEYLLTVNYRGKLINDLKHIPSTVSELDALVYDLFKLEDMPYGLFRILEKTIDHTYFKIAHNEGSYEDIRADFFKDISEIAKKSQGVCPKKFANLLLDIVAKNKPPEKLKNDVKIYESRERILETEDKELHMKKDKLDELVNILFQNKSYDAQSENVQRFLTDLKNGINAAYKYILDGGHLEGAINNCLMPSINTVARAAKNEHDEKSWGFKSGNRTKLSQDLLSATVKIEEAIKGWPIENNKISLKKS